MGDGRLSTEDPASTLDGTELIEISQSGTTKVTTAQAIRNLGPVSSSDPGYATASGEWELIETQVASNSSELEFLLPSGYLLYNLVYSHVVPVDDNIAMFIAASLNSGSSYLNTSGDYYGHCNRRVSNGSASYTYRTTSTEGCMILENLGNAPGEQASGDALLMAFDSTSLYKMIRSNSANIAATGELHANFGGGFIRTASAVNAIKVVMETGNISSGTFSLYGEVL